MNKLTRCRSISSVGKLVVQCRQCPRLVAWREEAAREKVLRYRDSEYWGKPVPGFGDPGARLLLVGLAPAAHGGNRTGRMFTGDRSGEWLYRTLHTFGFASSAASVSVSDRLELMDCYITAAARCAPPQNKLLPEELAHCRPYLLRELELLRHVRVIVGLGKTGFDAVFNATRSLGLTQYTQRPAFGHGVELQLNERQTLLGSFHPSQQNTFTGRLTQPMFDAVFRRAVQLIRRQ